MHFRSALATCTASLVAVTLHGCGGSTTTTSKAPSKTTTAPPTPKTTMTTTTTTTTVFKPAVPDIDGLNKLYMGFTPGSTTANFGVTVRFVATSHADDGQWFYCHTPCYQGHCDCRVSAAVLNNKVMIKEVGSVAHVISVYGKEGQPQPSIGIIFNQTTVEKQLAKCYYQFDGATDLRYNMGCACGVSDPAFENCSSPQSPFQNIDPKTGKEMSPTSVDVTRCHCGEGVKPPLPSHTTDSQCFWKGSAFYPDAGKNEISDMFAQRMKNNEGTDPVSGQKDRVKKEYWNEVVIDGLLMEKQFKMDPATVIQGILWTKTGDAASDKDARRYADSLAGYFKKTLFLTENPAVITMDSTIDVKKTGPFSLTHPGESLAV